MSSGRLGLLLLGVVALTFACRAGEARAASQRGLTSACKIHVIRGDKKPGAFPAQLNHYRKQLQAHPFSTLRSFQLLKVTPLKLLAKQWHRAPLAGTYRLKLSLVEQLLTAGNARRLRLKMQLWRHRPQRKARRLLSTQLTVSPGATIFVLGPRFETGRLVIGLTCR